MNRIALKKLKRMIPLNCLTKTGKKKKLSTPMSIKDFQVHREKPHQLLIVGIRRI
jgi:hypothetical protein